jgi:multidrug transporter EmrE-like cation transporter
MTDLAKNFLLFVVYVTASSGGLLLLKDALGRIRNAGEPLFEPSLGKVALAGGFILYVFSFAIWLRILSRTQLSIAYPIAIGLTLTFTTLGAVLMLGERLSAMKLVGILFVFVGCIALSLESR